MMEFKAVRLLDCRREGGREGREGGRERGGMTIIKIIILVKGMFNSNPILTFSPSHLEGSSTPVGRPGHYQSPVLAVENVDVRQHILFDVPHDGVHVS